MDLFYGFCINDTDLQEITKTEVGITKTEVAWFFIVVQIQIPYNILEQTHCMVRWLLVLLCTWQPHQQH